MKPTEAQRLSLRSRLVAAIGEPDATVLMEAMPPIDYDNLATKDDLARTFGALDELRSDMEGRFAMVDARFAQIDARFDQIDARFAQVDARFAEVDARFVAITAELRGEMATLGGQLRNEIAGLRTEMAAQTRNLVATQIASMLGVAGLILGFG